jgi:dihydroorotate dehydrogenase electron transfer subunit
LADQKNIHITTVRSIQQVAHDIYLMILAGKSIASAARAGQFINIAIPQCSEILWRRPFSIHRTDPQKETFEILFHALGRGTQALKNMKSGDALDIIGPLGNSFQISTHLHHALIIAGGLGIAPFALLVQEFAARKIQSTVFYGAKSEQNLCGVQELAEYGAACHISTEDGSRGFKGFVTDLFAGYLAKKPATAGTEIFVCGPTPMLKRVRETAIVHNIPAQVSVENLMACGFGACVGCPVQIASPGDAETQYWLACKDGPVFYLDKITFDD